jgi:SAM-dependent methyltransferase
MTATFDPQQYKRTTKQQWEDAAEAWHRWGPTLETWLGEATERMLDAAGITDGSRVLDVAAGAGGQSLAAAARVGATGRVLATDISPTILTYAAKAAADAGYANLDTQTVDGEELDVDEASFDAVISRVGLIYFPDQQRALAGMRRALRPGGRLSAIVYSTPDRNEFFSIPVGIIRRRAELPPPLPGQPGPFSLGAPGVIKSAFTDAGFSDVSVTTVHAPVRMARAADCVQFERDSFGALHQMLSGLSEAEREEAWAEIGRGLERFETSDGFEGPCELLVASGTK